MFHITGESSGSSNFYHYYNRYINHDWKQEYFAYDHFKTLCNGAKAKVAISAGQPSNESGILFTLQQKCYEDIKKVHRFIINMILTIDMDLQTINEMLEADGIRVKKPSQIRTILTRKASDAGMLYGDCHIARQSSVVWNSDGAPMDSSGSSEKNRRLRSKSGQLGSQLAYSSVGDEDGNEEIEIQGDTSSRSRALTTEKAIRERSIELSMRNIYLQIKQLEQFYHLNFYVISKISKKIDKLLKLEAKVMRSEKESSEQLLKYGINTLEDDVKDAIKNNKVLRPFWKDTKTGRFFYKEFAASKKVIEELKDECVASYAKKFRKTYTNLATYELEYVKEKDRTNSWTKFFVGIKFGLIACMVSIS
jgi:hypothetical protein